MTDTDILIQNLRRENETLKAELEWKQKEIELARRHEMQWISVYDKLPEIKQDVLMYFDSGNMAVGFWHDGDEHITFWCAYTDDGWFADCDCMPLYWMPLPEPPEEVNDGRE